MLAEEPTAGREGDRSTSPAVAGSSTARFSTRRQFAALLMAAQAAVGLMLWSAFDTSATFRGWFDLDPTHPGVTRGFFLADMFIVVCSAVSAWALLTGRRWAVIALAVTTGAILYPTVYLASWIGDADGAGTNGFVLMLLPAVLNPWVLLTAWRDLDRT